MDYHGIGLLAGFIGVFIAIVIIRIVTKDKRASNAHDYDERQLALRNAAFQKGFLTMVFVGIIYGGLEVAGLSVCQPGVGLILTVYIGICVFACVAIYKDAYFGLNQQKTKMMILFSIVGAVQWFNVIMQILDHEFLEDGKLGFAGASLGCAVLFTIIVVMLLIHHEPEEDEE